MTDLRKKIDDYLVPLLEDEGFKKRSGGIFTRKIEEDFVGWLGLNRAQHPEGVELNPVVGVRCQELESLLSMLLKERPHKFIPPTVGVSIGYLMPEQRYQSWIFREGTVSEAGADMVAVIVRYGVPFMESACTLRNIDALLESPQFSSIEHAGYRRPLIKWLLGDRIGALQDCISGRQQIEKRTDLAAESFRQFVREFELLANQVDA